jgi:hypothetical protein
MGFLPVVSLLNFLCLIRSFEQIDNSLTRTTGGTGLGLAICTRLCRNMGLLGFFQPLFFPFSFCNAFPFFVHVLPGGSIRLSSEEGKGSTFTCEIEFGRNRIDGRKRSLSQESGDFRANQPAESVKIEDGLEHPSTGGAALPPPVVETRKRLRCLVGESCQNLREKRAIWSSKLIESLSAAEDNTINQRVIKQKLSKEGHDVFLANDGLEAVKLYKEHNGRFDIIFMVSVLCLLFLFF